MKIIGIVDTDKMTIEVDDKEEELKTLLSDFNDCCVEINVKFKDETEFDKPTKANE